MAKSAKTIVIKCLFVLVLHEIDLKLGLIFCAEVPQHSNTPSFYLPMLVPVFVVRKTHCNKGIAINVALQSINTTVKGCWYKYNSSEGVLV